MTPKKFDQLARALFGSILEPLGFDVSKSQCCTFYKAVGEDVFCFVMPDISRGGDWYDVKVFASSPRIDPSFEKGFPDSVGIPSDVHCFLHSSIGVGVRQERYPCKTESELKDGFDNVVKQALVEKAAPYLSKFKQVNDLIPFIKNQRFLGAALYEIGSRKEAKEILASERSRLLKMDNTEASVKAWLDFMTPILD